MTKTDGALVSTLISGVLLLADAAWGVSATDHVKASVERVLQVVRDAELAKPANAGRRHARIREEAGSLLAFEEMAKRALGRHWAERSPEQRRHFTTLFTDLLERSYVEKIEAYAGEKIEYLPEQLDGDSVTVRSRIVTRRGTQIPIDYRAQWTGGRVAVYDLAIEGVSLVSNYRVQFNRIITQSSYEELVKRMERKQLETSVGERTSRLAPSGRVEDRATRAAVPS